MLRSDRFGRYNDDVLLRQDQWQKKSDGKVDDIGWRDQLMVTSIINAYLDKYFSPALDEAGKLSKIVLDQCSGYTSGPGFVAAQQARALNDALKKE